MAEFEAGPVIDLFNTLDNNGDGKLSKIELINGVHHDSIGTDVSNRFRFPKRIKQEDCTRDIFMRIFHEIDTDGNGNITLDEMVGYFRKLFNEDKANEIL